MFYQQWKDIEKVSVIEPSIIYCHLNNISDGFEAFSLPAQVQLLPSAQGLLEVSMNPYELHCGYALKHSESPLWVYHRTSSARSKANGSRSRSSLRVSVLPLSSMNLSKVSSPLLNSAYLFGPRMSRWNAAG